MKKIVLSSALAISLFGCQKDDNPIAEVIPTGTKIYIGNEGNFGMSNADVSYIDAEGAIHNDVYQSVNGMPLGDVLQSITIDDGKVFAVLNNSNKIEIFGSSDYAPIQTIDGVNYPRFIYHLNESKAYISSGSGAGTVYVVDKTNFTLGTEIPVGDGPENMTVSNNKLYVCNSGGWGNDNTVTVVNTLTDEVTTSIALSDQPVDAVTDANGDVWVLCKGQTLYDETWTIVGHSDARMYHINEETDEVLGFYTIGNNGDHPYSMAISNSGQDIYVANGDLYHLSITDMVAHVWIEGSFGSVDVSQNSGYLWLTSINDYINPSTVYAYNAAGAFLKQYTAGIGANAVVEP